MRSTLIAIAYDLNFRHGAEIFSGATDYIKRNEKNWQLLPLSYGFESKLMELVEARQLTGAIGTFISDEWLSGITSREVACINIFNLSQILSVSSVELDDEAIGKIAAEHLVEQGAQSFAFIGQDEAYFNRTRRRSFQKCLPNGLYKQINPRSSRIEQLNVISSLPRPIGLLCASDRIARELTQLAPNYGLQCGKDFLLVGIGNEPSESTFAGIGLSSFEIPAREIGYLAASMMAETIESKDHFAPKSVQMRATLHPRESTLSSRRARITEQTKKMIEESITDPQISIDSIAERVGTSRRSLELTLQQQLGTSPYQLISSHRLEKAKNLLKETTIPVGKVGERCGYPEPHHFSAWFKKKSGLAPRVYRAQRTDQSD